MELPSKEQLKERAKSLREILKQKYKIDMAHGHALEVIAKLFGIKDWNTAAALSEGKPRAAPSVAQTAVAEAKKEMPSAARFKTTGELREFLTHFPDSTRLVINEYKETKVEDAHKYNFGIPTFVCTPTYDGEIQKEGELRLELDQENFKVNELSDFGKSVGQRWEKTNGGRIQRVIKMFHMRESFWNPENLKKHNPIS
jgi:hypothetical protein